MGRDGQDVQVLVAVTATDFPSGLRSLFDDLRADLDRSALSPSALGVIALENSISADARGQSAAAVQELANDGVEALHVDRGHRRAAIAETRHALTCEIARWAGRGRRAAVYWMIDDDLRLETLRLDAGGQLRSGTEGYLRGWLSHGRAGRIDLGVGSVTGDPPIRPEMMILCQVSDLLANLSTLLALPPLSLYEPYPTGIFDLPDYYYDLTDHGDRHLSGSAPWLPESTSGTSVRDQLLALLDAGKDLPHGRAVTRPVVDNRAAVDPGADLRRGGNAAFFTLDACLSHPYPTLTVAGTMLRRSDMVGAALLRRSGFDVRRVPVAIRHRRTCGQHESRFGRRSAPDVWDSITAEFFGVLVARLVMDPSAEDALPRVTRLANGRSTRLTANLRRAAGTLDQLRDLVRDPPGWARDDAEVRHALAGFAEAIDGVSVVVGGWSDAAREEWLTALREHLTRPEHLSQTVCQVERAEYDARRQRAEALAALGGQAP